MTTSAQPNIQEKLDHSIDSLMSSSMLLRQAITARKTEEIWDILATLEEQAISFNQYFQLWQEISIETTLSDQQTNERNMVRQKLIRLKAVQQANAALTHSYLSAVRKAMHKVGDQKQRKPNTYNARGRMGRRNTSVLIQSVG